MPVLLGDRPSASPVPAGRPTRKPVTANTSRPFPAQGNYLAVNGDAAIGPFNLPYRYWLCVVTNSIFQDSVSWTRRDVAHRLVVNGSYGSDLNGRSLHQNADCSEATNWDGQSIESQWYCEANVTYYVYYVSWNTPSSQCYYSAWPGHTNFFAYTVGEGVY